MSKTSLKNIITFAGAVLAFMIGSGFATGQELMQYYVPYGWSSVLIGLMLAVILIFANRAFAIAGHYYHLEKGSDVFRFYCGDLFGRFFDWFTVGFCFLVFIVMIAGAGSTLVQQYSLPLYVGIIAMALIAAFTVSMGLDSLVSIIGKIGPLLAILVLFIAVITLANYGENIPENIAQIKNGELILLSASAHPFWAGISNAGYSLLLLAGFVSQLAQKNSYRQVMAGQVIGISGYAAVSVLVAFALLAAIHQLGNVQIPNLLLANQISPIFGAIFGLIIFAAIFTTACPLLWTVTARLAEEKSLRFKLLPFFFAAIAVVVARFIPFALLIRYIYVLGGYCGAVMLIFIAAKLLRLRKDYPLKQ